MERYCTESLACRGKSKSQTSLVAKQNMKQMLPFQAQSLQDSFGTNLAHFTRFSHKHQSNHYLVYPINSDLSDLA